MVLGMAKHMFFGRIGYFGRSSVEKPMTFSK